mmetsp:Transcript_11682/g.50370  ORF Transcript_11682/g.50370 Transcript_11682/m.50370 type:complete len:808 (-) Transcript_11682:1916-4339(-)
MASLSELLNPTGGMEEHDYAQLPSMIEEEYEEEYDDQPGAMGPDGHGFLKGEVGSSLRIRNLDAWFQALYQYYKEKGFYCIVTSRVVNLLTLGFTIFLSGFILLYLDFAYLSGQCAEDGEECHILRDATFRNPLRHRSFLYNLVVVCYLMLFSLFFLWSLARLAHDFKPLLEMRAFCNRKLQLSDRDIQTITWPEVVARVVHLQATTRLCIVKDLNEHDIVARILRKENYLLGMLNREVIGLKLNIPFFRNRVWLTKAVEWNLDWAIFNGMFDDDFSIRPSFYDVTALRLRMRYLAVVNLVLSPFIAIFLAMYFVMNNAERFYRHPGVVGQREWSTHAWWKLREFNELSHFTEQRLAAAYKGANNYVSQFPSPVVSMVAKFVSYIVGALAAVALALPLLLDDKLLHANVMWDKDILWVTMVSATVLAVSRGMVGEENRVFRPNRYMAEVVRHTHYLPKNWRNLAHKAEVQAEFEDMFAFKAGLFLQEMLSIFAVPFILWYPMCESAPDIVQFVRQFTVHRKGVGHICSLSAFDFRRHGDARYGAPTSARRDARSKQGKMEKSFVSFHAHYPTWEPDVCGREMLTSLAGFKSALYAGVGPEGAGVHNVNESASRFGVASRFGNGTGGAGGGGSKFAAPGSASMFLGDAGGGGGMAGSVARAGDDDGDASRDEREEEENQVLLQQFYEFHSGDGTDEGDDGGEGGGAATWAAGAPRDATPPRSAVKRRPDPPASFEMTESASLTPPSSMPRLSSSLPGTGPGTPPTMNGISGAPTSAPSADTTDSDELDAANFDDPPDLFQLENGTRGF